MKQFEFGGLKLAYRQTGQGPAVVLLHGFCEDSHIWDFCTDTLVVKGYQVIAIDLPGFGASSVKEGITIDEMAAGVQSLCSILQLDPFVLIGHSMGGYVALSFAEQFPDAICGFGLMHSHALPDSLEKRANRQKSIEFIDKNGHLPYVKQLFPNLFPEGRANDYTEAIQLLTTRAKNYDARGIQAALNAMAHRPKRLHVLEQTEVPVLFLLGEEDQLVPAEVRDQMISLPEVAHLNILAETGHMGMYEAPQKITTEISHFLEYCYNIQP